MSQEKSVGVLLFTGAAPKQVFLLLLRYGAGHWSFAKGHVEQGESEKQTALRELEEETGIGEGELEFVDGFRETTQYFFKRDDMTIPKTVVLFLAHAKKKPAVKLSDEHTQFAWLSGKEALERITYESDRQVLRAALDFIAKH